MALEASTHTKENKDGSAYPQWLAVGINALALIVTILIASIYYGQLDQMRVATQASTKAADYAGDAIIQSSGQFDRTVKQLVYQTVFQAESAKATQRASNAAKDAADTAKTSLILSQAAQVALMSAIQTPSGPEFYFINVGNTDAVNIIVQFRSKSYSPASNSLLADPRADIKEFRAHPENPSIAAFLYMEKEHEKMAMQYEQTSPENLKAIRDDILRTQFDGKPQALVMNLAHNGTFGKKYEMASTAIGDVLDQLFVMVDWDDVLPVPHHHTNDMCFVIGAANQAPAPCVTAANIPSGGNK